MLSCTSHYYRDIIGWPQCSTDYIYRNCCLNIVRYFNVPVTCFTKYGHLEGIKYVVEKGASYGLKMMNAVHGSQFGVDIMNTKLTANGMKKHVPIMRASNVFNICAITVVVGLSYMCCSRKKWLFWSFAVVSCEWLSLGQIDMCCSCRRWLYRITTVV